MLLFSAISFFFVTMGRKKIPCTCVPTCKTDAACRQKRSKAKRKQQALADQAFALAVVLVLLQVGNTLPASSEYNDNLADMSDGASSLSSFASIYHYRFIKWQ